VDKNDYYGGFDAAFSLREAEEWAKKVNDSDTSTNFQNAQIHLATDGSDGAPSKILEQSRKYTLSLSPQLIYAQSKLLPALVSSRVHTQLEFQAVGSWWVHKGKKLQRIPSGREDVFADDTLSRRDKIALMKFLRTVVNKEEHEELEEAAEVSQKEDNKPLASLLDEYKISEALNQALLALSLSPLSSRSTRSSYAFPRIKRHMTSIGAFGPGFGAVLPKYGGNAEIAQVGCRAGAVGGGVYVLGAGIIGQEPADALDQVRILLSNGEKVTSRYVVGNMDDLSHIDWTETDDANPSQKLARSMHHISIISSPLKQLFPQTSDNGPVPAGAIVFVDDRDSPNASSLYLQVHSEDTGECPSGQCEQPSLPSYIAVPHMMIQLMNTYLHCLNFIVDTYPLTT
jgi:Rab proteins geranylgeranyltransferase component A